MLCFTAFLLFLAWFQGFGKAKKAKKAKKATKAKKVKTFEIFIGLGISAQTPVAKAKNHETTASKGQFNFFMLGILS